jgi:TctA family transporter
MKKYNYIVSVVMLLLSGYIFYESSGYTIGSSAQKNPAVWPCMLIMGVIGFVLIKLDFAMPPIILGLVLGSLAEKNARRSIDLLGSSETIWQHPIAIIFIVLAIASLVSPAISAAIKKRKAAKAAAAEEN